MRRGGLIRMRRRSAGVALLCVAVLLVAPVAPRRAEARYDPLRIITSQIVRPNIMLVLDTSGSMAERPESSNLYTDLVGGDCYEGQNCKPGPTPDTCPDGKACGNPNTCADGVSPCSPGDNGYCPDGTACSVARLCGSAPSKTECRDSSPRCRDGSACKHVCQDGTTTCSSNLDCPAAACRGKCKSGGASCGTSADCPGSGTCSVRKCSIGGNTCSTDADCGVSICMSNRRCSLDSSDTCSASQVGTTAGCKQPTCGSQRYCSNDTSDKCSKDSECATNTCQSRKCSTDGSSCSGDDDCSNKCDTSSFACDASTGSAACTYWCGDGSQCSAPESYCEGPNNTKTSCAQVCPDGSTTCYAQKHCGADSCPSGSVYVYKGSSRLAIAKHVISELISSTSDLVNYGFMTFSQTGYYPYVSGGTPVQTTGSRYFSKDELANLNALNGNGSPKNSFTSGGITYTLGVESGPNSRYRRNSSNLDHDYCGSQCTINGKTWNYRGSHYSYTQTTVAPATVKLLSSYDGPTVDGLTYYSFPHNYVYPDTCNVNADCLSNSCSSSSVCTCSSNAKCKSGVCASGYCRQATCSTSTINPVSPVCGDSTSSSSCNASTNEAGRVLEEVIITNDVSQRAAALARIESYLAPQNAGGLVASGGTPSGCTLQYDLSGTAPSSVGNQRDAYSYMKNLRASDPQDGCRKNYVIFVTDGEPNGPGDNKTCDDQVCNAILNPTLAGCTCRSVLAANNLFLAGVRTYAIGFGAETAGAPTMDNIARAGGTCRPGGCAFSAANEDQLTAALTTAVYDALQGDYATSAPTVATSAQSGGATYVGNIGLLASTEFPSWRGHFRAVDLVNQQGGKPTPLWDAGQILANRPWNTRRIYTSSPNTNTLIPFMNGGTVNASELHAAGLGASLEEAEAIARFSLGQNRDWKLGSILNSTPVTMGKSIDLDLPGHDAYVAASSPNRPAMVYIGADDGMLHAFYLESGSWGNAGDEAWAYVPPDMLKVLTTLYVNGGQPTNPFQHIYGMSSSPKINDVCSGACAEASDWKTVLVSGEGAGGAHYFALDISALPSAPAPISVLWTTSNDPTYAQKGGQSWSVPAFGFIGSSPLRSIVSFGSGYDSDPKDAYTQGRWFTTLDAVTGAEVFAAQIPMSGSSVVEFAVLADTATAVDPSTQRTIAAYQADLGGRIWRYSQASTNAGKPFYDAGPTHPYYYAPAALPRADGSVVLAAVDSTFYDEKINSGTNYVPNLTVLLDAGGTAAASVALPVTSICADACHHRDCGSCTKFGPTARPISSPVILVNNDPTATAQVQALFSIYQPATSVCAPGQSALVVLDVEIGANNNVSAVQSEAKAVPGGGLSSGITLGAGGEVVTGNSGRGANAQSSVTAVSGQAKPYSLTQQTSNYSARIVGIAEAN